MENKIELYKKKFKKENLKFIFPVLRKNKSMSLIFEKKDENIFLDKSFIKIKTLDFLKKEKKINKNKLKEKEKKNFMSKTNFFNLSQSTFTLKKPDFLISNFDSPYNNSYVYKNSVLKNKRNLFKNKILRDAIYKRGNKIVCDKETNTERLSKVVLISPYFEYKDKFSQVQIRNPNLKLSKYKKIKVTENFSLNFFYTPKESQNSNSYFLRKYYI